MYKVTYKTATGGAGIFLTAKPTDLANKLMELAAAGTEAEAFDHQTKIGEVTRDASGKCDFSLITEPAHTATAPC